MQKSKDFNMQNKHKVKDKFTAAKVKIYLALLLSIFGGKALFSSPATTTAQNNKTANVRTVQNQWPIYEIPVGNMTMIFAICPSGDDYLLGRDVGIFQPGWRNQQIRIVNLLRNSGKLTGQTELLREFQAKQLASQFMQTPVLYNAIKNGLIVPLNADRVIHLLESEFKLYGLIIDADGQLQLSTPPAPPRAQRRGKNR
jgi:hypothetical protein